MCKIVQLSLDFRPFGDGVEFDTLKHLYQAAMRQGLQSEIIDPCKGCDLAEVCGHDDCAHHLFDLDSPEPPRGSFEDWLYDYSD